MSVLVTRPLRPGAGVGSGDPLVRALEKRGIDVIHVPTVAIEPADPGPLVLALRRRPPPAWVVVTSANGAGPVAEAARRAGGMPSETRVAAVGPPTASALRDVGIQVDHVPATFLTLAIASGLGEVHGRRIVLARADAATPDLRLKLERMGAAVDEVVAYRTVEGPSSSGAPLLSAFGASRPRLMIFTSGSTVRGLAGLLAAHPSVLHTARAIPAACIGPVTAAEARRLGFTTPVIASTHTAAALATAVATYLDQERVA